MQNQYTVVDLTLKQILLNYNMNKIYHMYQKTIKFNIIMRDQNTLQSKLIALLSYAFESLPKLLHHCLHGFHQIDFRINYSSLVIHMPTRKELGQHFDMAILRQRLSLFSLFAMIWLKVGFMMHFLIRFFY